ncbi:MAG: nitrous oxide reductase family maturation protein NosD [Candidatus Thiodiazotropha sp. (ex Lucinoma borealis)]|nr:nitrous oxide reductase family maturation protein NosD [Candidatus Thiodiazotropha sp. (ex Lucinoma borealis)]MCU7864285.1 nitrous oxide reductase family maturation protein NosD [Candidatus Thiodiazotropha sp. (ex Lucinoma borealis)]
MKYFVRSVLAFVSLVVSQQIFALPPLQLFIDLTPVNGTLRPPPGTYTGPIVISKPIILDGQNKVTIDGVGEGTVLTVRADNTTIKGLQLTGSGESYDAMDAGLMIEADGVLVEGNTLDNVLFGIHIKQGNENTIRDNDISSKPFTSSLRGEGLRIWYGHDNLIENNTIHHVRDLLLSNATSNRIIGNRLYDNRISMEFIYSHENEIRDNHISHNDTGIVAIYSNNLIIERNRIEHIRNTGSSALAIKESSQVHIVDNEILHNATGLKANSPIFPENILYLENNNFSYNNIAMYFYGEKGGHIIHGNHFLNNLTTIAVSHIASARNNDWLGNHWDDYEGFDRDLDSVGDTPHTINLYADRIWMDRPVTQFFRGTPIMGLIDFVERLAPFSEPGAILTDARPRMR